MPPHSSEPRRDHVRSIEPDAADQAVKDIRPGRITQGQDGRLTAEVEISAAIVDRITFGGDIIETGTDSYRLAQTRARAEEATRTPS
jgi:hypothetical protein